MRRFTTRLAAVCDRLNHEKARYVLVDARALQLWGLVMATRDIHLLIQTSPRNAARVLRALRAMGMGFATEGLAGLVAGKAAICLGSSPRVDLLTQTGGIAYEQAAASASTFFLEGVPIPTAGLDHLRRAGHAQEIAQIELLRDIHRGEGT